METSTKVTNLKVDKLGQPTIKCEFSVTDIVKVINEVGVFIHDSSAYFTLQRILESTVMNRGWFQHFKTSDVFSLHRLSGVVSACDHPALRHNYIRLMGAYDDYSLAMTMYMDEVIIAYTDNKKILFKMTARMGDDDMCNVVFVMKGVLSILGFSPTLKQFIGMTMHNYYVAMNPDGWRLD